MKILGQPCEFQVIPTPALINMGCGRKIARGDTIISTENDSDDSKIMVRIPKEWQSMTANDPVQNGSVAPG